MRPLGALPVLAGLALLAPAAARAWDVPGWLVGISVEVDGWEAPLYPDPGGSGRFYLEARPGSRYTVHLANRTGERLGVVLTVDGLNVVTGERDPGPARPFWSRPGRMYVLDPWDAATVKGWRTSLEDVRQFTFVDERASYAVRSGKANGRMGWIEVAVYRERRPLVWRRWWDEVTGRLRSEPAQPRDDAERERDQASRAPSGGDEASRSARGEEKSAGAAAEKAAPEAQKKDEELRSLGSADRADGVRPRPPESYPGTGWGSRSHDPVVVVQFEPESRPAECVTLRYEYAGALRALGVLPRPGYDRDRLAEREHGRDGGFARPPDW